MNQLGKAWYGLGSDQAVYVSSTFRSWYATLPAMNQSRTKITYLGMDGGRGERNTLVGIGSPPKKVYVFTSVCSPSRQ